MRTAALLLSVSLLASPILVTSCVAQERAAAAQPRFVLEPGELQLATLIDRAAAFLQWNILSNQTEMSASGGQPARLQQRIETDRDGCEDVLTGLLYRAGFVVLPIDESKGLYEVIAMQGPRSREITMRAVRRTAAEILARPRLVMPVTVAVQLKHINAPIATNALRPFFASSGGPGLTIGNVGNNTAMVVSGLQDQVATVLRLLDTCDVPQPEDQATPPIATRLEAIEKRLAALEQKAGAQPQAK